jgi:hypothetical protein
VPYSNEKVNKPEIWVLRLNILPQKMTVNFKRLNWQNTNSKPTQMQNKPSVSDRIRRQNIHTHIHMKYW